MACRLFGAKAIIYINAGLLTIGPLRTNFNVVLIKLQNISLKKIHLKISSAKWQPFCPDEDDLLATDKPPGLGIAYGVMYTVYCNMYPTCHENEWTELKLTKMLYILT